MTTALVILRCAQIGLSVSDMERLTLGAVFDVITEKNNDSFEYRELATQDDFNRF